MSRWPEICGKTHDTKTALYRDRAHRRHSLRARANHYILYGTTLDHATRCY